MKLRAFVQTADNFWLKREMFFKSEKQKTKYVEERNIYDAGMRMLHQGVEDGVVRPKCS